MVVAVYFSLLSYKYLGPMQQNEAGIGLSPLTLNEIRLYGIIKNKIIVVAVGLDHSWHVFDNYVGRTILTGQVSHARQAEKKDKSNKEEPKANTKNGESITYFQLWSLLGDRWSDGWETPLAEQLLLRHGEANLKFAANNLNTNAVRENQLEYKKKRKFESPLLQNRKV